MSSVFYDHLLDMDRVEKLVKKHVKTPDERREIYALVDEIVHHRVVGCILDTLPKEHHTEFLERFSKKPHDTSLMDYLTQKVGHDISAFIRQEIFVLGTELLEIIRPKFKDLKD